MHKIIGKKNVLLQADELKKIPFILVYLLGIIYLLIYLLILFFVIV